MSHAHVLGPFAVAIGLLALLCVVGFFVLSGVRGYVAGESVWSKSRSAALAQLRVYVVSGAPQAYQRFVAALAVPLGDRDAREALDQQPVDLQAARAGLLRGGNDAADVDVMVWLYHCCSKTALMRDAVAAWVEADRLIAELSALGLQLQRRDRAARGRLAEPERVAAMLQLDALEDRLIAQELRFSSSLGQASRAVLWLLCVVTVLFAALLACAGMALGRRGLLRYDQSQQQLAQANRRWTLATASDGLGMFEWDLARDTLLLDARTAGLWGFEPHPEGLCLPRLALRERVHADDRPAVAASLRQSASSGELFRQRFRVIRHDGTERHLEVTGLMHQAGPQQASRMVGVTRDVSDEVQHTRLELEKAAAERVARTRIEFLSRLSHELRTPLNAVLGFSQLMLADPKEPLSAGNRSRVQHIGAAGRHLLHLVEDVLDITHIDSGNFAMSLQPLALQPVVDAALQLVEQERQGQDVHIELRLPVQPLWVVGDAQRLEQVFVNLLSNGCKYNRRGGTLTVGCDEAGGCVNVNVRDEGAGLDACERAQLFQPFKRLAPAGVQGTGLGLVVVKLLLEQMGGGIVVDSQKGQGSTFTVRLPVAPVAPASGVATSAQDDSATRSRTTAAGLACP